MEKYNQVKVAQVGEVPNPPFYIMPLLGEPAPPFKAITTKGFVDFPTDYKGKWVVFFSHPGDFEPVCTTEFMYLQEMQKAFLEINTELLGLSVDSIASHLAWIQSIYYINWNGMSNVKINFPIVADPTMEISKRYGMVHRGETESRTVRALFIIDPNSIVRNILYYSNRTGRNINEVLRVVEALQTAEKNNAATPCNWEPYEPVIIPPPQTTFGLLEREQLENENAGVNCVAWYLCFKQPITNAMRNLGITQKRPPFTK